MSIGPDEVAIWTAPLSASREVICQYARTLSPGELERAAAFRFPHLRDAYVIAHGTARRILAGLLGERPEQVRIREGKNRKPELIGPEAFHFNMAHSGNLMALAATRIAHIGVDLEQARSMPDLKRVSESFFAHEEREQLQGPQETLACNFFRCWTLKEAFLKATGEGLSRPLHSFAVAFAPGAETALLRIEDPPDDPAAWTLRSFKPAPGYSGAWAIRATGVRPVYRSFEC